MMLESLKRINELATKHKREGLSNSELKERDILRQTYLSEIRGQVHSTITNLKVLDPLGNDVTPAKLMAEKKNSMIKK